MKDVKGKVTMNIFIPGFIGLLLAYFSADYLMQIFGIYDKATSGVGLLYKEETIQQVKLYGSFLIFPFFYIGAWWGAKRALDKFGTLITQEVSKHVQYYLAFLSFFAILLTAPEMIIATVLYSITLTSYLVKKWLPITAFETTVVKPIGESK